ncbi:hypothetical protein [Streptomyces sp. NPDC017202]|uniref:hypothetical protein n=1 Tax=Streptomyces sp. NPDC017202 TaxID=3364981 RepID=UPI0037A18DAC
MTASAPVPPPPATPPAGARVPSRWAAPLVAALVAAGAGLGIGWLLWAGPAGAASGTGLAGAAADAAGACEAWDRVPALREVFSDDKASEASYDRAGGAAALAGSAARTDPRYDALDKALQDVMRRLQTFDVKSAEAVAAHDRVSTLCAGLDG